MCHGLCAPGLSRVGQSQGSPVPFSPQKQPALVKNPSFLWGRHSGWCCSCQAPWLGGEVPVVPGKGLPVPGMTDCLLLLQPPWAHGRGEFGAWRACWVPARPGPGACFGSSAAPRGHCLKQRDVGLGTRSAQPRPRCMQGRRLKLGLVSCRQMREALGRLDLGTSPKPGPHGTSKIRYVLIQGTDT